MKRMCEGRSGRISRAGMPVTRDTIHTRMSGTVFHPWIAFLLMPAKAAIFLRHAGLALIFATVGSTRFPSMLVSDPKVSKTYSEVK
jgi:hypothetical protein